MIKSVAKNLKIFNLVSPWQSKVLDDKQKAIKDKYRTIFRLYSLFIGTFIVLIYMPIFTIFAIKTYYQYIQIEDLNKIILYLFVCYLPQLVIAYRLNKFVLEKSVFKHLKEFNFYLFYTIVFVTQWSYNSVFIVYAFGGELLSLAMVTIFICFFLLLTNVQRILYIIYALTLYSILILFPIFEEELYNSKNIDHLYQFFGYNISTGILILIFFYILGGLIYNIWLNGVLHRYELKQSLSMTKKNNEIISKIAENQKNIINSIYLNLKIEHGSEYSSNTPLMASNKIRELIKELSNQQKETEILKNHYLDIFNNIFDGIIIRDAFGIITKTNIRALEILNITEQEVIGKELPKVLDIINLEQYNNYNASLREIGHYSSFELHYTDYNYKTAILEITSSAIIDQIGNFKGSRDIFHNITQRKNTESQLLQARISEKIFLANMSHEIRTPLNAIIGMSNLLYDTPLNLEQKELVEAVSNSSTFLHQLISDILDITKLESKKYELQLELFDLHGLLKTIKQSFSLKLQNENIEVRLKIDGNISQLYYGENALLKQILYNLVGNASKFTKQGHISILVSKLAKNEKCTNLQFSIEDTGVGIPEDKIYKIFDKFTQVQQKDDSKAKGTGLGLAIVKEIIDLVGGTIEVKSQINKGTCFSFTYPLKNVDNNENAIVDIPHGLNQQLISKNYEEMVFLVVEDNLLNRLYISKMFDRKGLKYELAKDGNEAIKMCQIKKYDVILMDIQMPIMDGIQATIELRESQNLNQNTLIIALSANAMKEHLQQAFDVGMNDFVTKPFTPSGLFNTLDKYFIGEK